MPAKLNNKLKRLYILVNQIKNKPSTREELFKCLASHDIINETATFERDKKTLRDDFGIELMYEPSTKKYKFEEIESEQVAQLLQLLQFHQLSKLLQESFFENKKALAFIDFENEAQLKGIEFLDKLFLATKNQQIIEIKHQRFTATEASYYHVKPYLIKQYQSRWYVVGETHNEIKIFGIDRIVDLTLLEEKFQRKKHDLKERFKSSIGVSQHTKKREHIQVAFHSSQKEYLAHLPLHSSQKLVSQNENEVVYEYFTLDNFELRQHILKYGSLAKVISPPYLVKEIKEELKKALKAY